MVLQARSDLEVLMVLVDLHCLEVLKPLQVLVPLQDREVLEPLQVPMALVNLYSLVILKFLEALGYQYFQKFQVLPQAQ